MPRTKCKHTAQCKRRNTNDHRGMIFWPPLRFPSIGSNATKGCEYSVSRLARALHVQIASIADTIDDRNTRRAFRWGPWYSVREPNKKERSAYFV